MPNATTVTVLTPPGRGAVASVAVEGPRAVELIDKLFTAASGKRIANLPLRRIAFGRWASAEGPDEELVVCRLVEDRIEVHCHGGRAAVEAIVASLVASGAVQQSPEDWVATHSTDEIQQEAMLALAEAKTERTALILLDQYHGAMRRELEAIERLQADDPAQARQRAMQLQATSNFGSHFTRPWRVAIAGRPNVGKSSLMNALLGFERSIVFDQPGTTRDAVTALTAFDGWPVELIDTAGLRETGDLVESLGVAVAEREIENADLVLYVHDATQPAPATNSSFLWVHNKCDLAPSASPKADAVRVSARTGEGIATLISTIVERLVPCVPQRGDAVLFTPRQIESLGMAQGIE